MSSVFAGRHDDPRHLRHSQRRLERRSGGVRHVPEVEEVVVSSKDDKRSSLDAVRLGKRVRVVSLQGERTFRRRLMEMGMVPGTVVTVVNVAPLGDPIEIDVRDSRLSIRRREAANVVVEF